MSTRGRFYADPLHLAEFLGTRRSSKFRIFWVPEKHCSVHSTYRVPAPPPPWVLGGPTIQHNVNVSSVNRQTFTVREINNDHRELYGSSWHSRVLELEVCLHNNNFRCSGSLQFGFRGSFCCFVRGIGLVGSCGVRMKSSV